MKEPQGKEVNFPDVDSLNAKIGTIANFVHKRSMGFEAEVMNSLSEKVWIGLEISSDLMTGENDNPGFYNFQFTEKYNQLRAFDPVNDTTYIFRTNYPVKYRTSLLNFIANFRIYPVPDGRFKPFLKASAGLSLVSTELSLKAPSLWMEKATQENGQLEFGPPVLFSRGTSDSSEGMMPALTLGGGAGFELQLTEKIALYADVTVRMVKSDILDGIPNLDYDDKTGRFNHFNAWSNVSKFSVGLVYSLGEGYSLFGSGGKKSHGMGKNKSQHPFLPFYEMKPW